MRLTITWLYPETMSIYGDRGNVIALRQRASWRGIEAVVTYSGLGADIPAETDIMFFGGGQDQQQIAAAHDLAGVKGRTIRSLVEQGAPLLSVCGGYQLLGHGYSPHDAERLPGISLFDADSVAGSERFIGNIVIDSEWGELVGFENHSGLTTLGSGARPLGRVRRGRGNNGVDGNEGAIYANAIGCYMHGSLLPKNPQLTDWLISKALERRYGDGTLAPLASDAEMDAHRTAVRRADTG